VTEREKLLAGEPYHAGDPEIQADLHRAARLTARYNATSVDELPLRRRLLEELLGSVGEDVVLRPPLWCDLGFRTTVGARTFANFNLVVLDIAPVTIGADVQIGPNVQLLTAVHPVDPAERRSGIESAEPIAVGDDSWLGGGVIVCPGVTIGAGCVVGAGAVVVGDLPAGVVAVGNPARAVRHV
jgi:maltose O-acetyltransferase